VIAPHGSAHAWLEGGGEMGALIRSMDWASTPIGPLESWSPALRMMVRLLLANRFPLLLWWGPQYVSLYNDPYRPVLGKKHPWALGRPVSECWSEIWHILQPLIDTPFKGGPATWNEDIALEINRHGFVEESHFTIAYSPVPDETAPSGIGGVLATVHEITEKIVGERRIVALRDLGARVGDARTAEEACAIAARTLSAHSQDIPFVLLYLLDEDRRRASLAGASGVEGFPGVGPAHIALDDTEARGWPLARAIRTETMQVVTALDQRFGRVPAGPWSDPPNTAVVLAIPSNRAGEPVGAMVAGVSARLKLDAYYNDFFDLVRTQIATAIGHAGAYEEERKRAEALAEIDRAKTAFFSNVSHEFRTPLTLRQEMERELRDRSDQYLALLNRAPLGLYLVDADFRIREINPVAQPLFADVPGGAAGRDFGEISHIVWEHDYAGETVRLFRRTLDTGEPHVALDHQRFRIDRGVSNRYERRLDRITLPDGRYGIVCYLRDVTEQQKAAAAKAYLAAIVDSAEDAIIAKDLDGVIQSCNDSAVRLFGYSAAELVGHPVRMLIPPERQSEEDHILQRLRRGERIDQFETVRVAKDGRRLDVALTVSPVRDDSGVIIGASKIVRDVTGLKRAEAERIMLLQENAAVTEALNSVGAIVASDLDQATVVQAVTDAGTELTKAEFGAFFYNVADQNGESYTLYTISGVPREAFSKVPMPRNTEVFAPTFTGAGVVRSDDITKDPRYGHNPPYFGMPPGHLPVRSYLAVPVKGRSGGVLGGLFFGHSGVARFDEHHERLAVGVASWASVALENARLYASVKEASRLKDDFLASLSHELRTPLNAILGYARMLRTGVVPPDKKQKAIETIERNATSLNQIVEDVLDISRIVSGKIRLNVQPVDVPDIVRAALDAIEPAADARGVRIETVLDPQASPISGDPDRLQQVLWNLLSNAVKFTNRGGKVQVRLARVNSHVEVTVSDTGVGIPPEFLPHVFERFRQADAGIARERGGLGLGLSIARQLTEMHGGTIEASSGGIGRGATFSVKLPLMIVHPIPEGLPRMHPRSASSGGTLPAADLGSLHVLAVDDDPDALSLVTEVLEAAGARVSAARSAHEALERLDAEVPDVMVADLGMPRVDGFGLIDRVRRHPDPRVRDVPAAALTAYARSEDRMKALRAGFQIHLAKPIDPAELVTTIAALARRFVVGDSGDSPIG
jgi:PAS domain S-box-containing protein